jgi:hypothetical protein
MHILVWMHLKVFLKLKKTLKLSLLGKCIKKPKKTKTQKPPQKPQKNHWAFFFKIINPDFSNPASRLTAAFPPCSPPTRTPPLSGPPPPISKWASLLRRLRWTSS